MTQAVVHRNVIRHCPSFLDLKEQQKLQDARTIGDFNTSGYQASNSVTSPNFLQAAPLSSVRCLDASCDKGEGSSSRSRQSSMFSELSSTSVSSNNSGTSESSSSSSLFVNDKKRLNANYPSSPNLPDDLFQVRTAKPYADAYERVRKEAQHHSICQDDLATDEEERWRSQLKEVGVPHFEAVMMVHRLKTYLTVPRERFPRGERHHDPPPTRPKENLHHVFAKLRSLLPEHNNTSNANSLANTKGKEVDRSPQWLAYSSSPLYWLADEDVDMLIKDHEIEWDVERVCVREIKAKIESRFAKHGDEAENSSLETGRRKRMILEDTDSKNHVFGVPLLQMQRYASLKITMGDYQHKIPLIVHHCVEQLYRTGLMFDHLFRAPPDCDKLDKLTKDYDTGPEFMPKQKGLQKLRYESIADIGALLRRYIDALPHSIMNPAIYEGFRCWCINPTVNLDESRRIEIAKILFKSMPNVHCVLLYYLFTFFSQIPLSSDCNNLDTHSISLMFAVPLLKHTMEDAAEKDEVCLVMTWILDRWGEISEGLFDVDEEATPRLPVEVTEEKNTHVPIQAASTSGSSSSSTPSTEESMFSSDNFISDGVDSSKTSLEIIDSDVGLPCCLDNDSCKEPECDKSEEDWKDYLIEERRKITCQM